MLALTAAILNPDLVFAAQDLTLPSMSLTLSGGAPEPSKVSVLLEILFLLTILSIAPAIMLTVTSFTRIIIVFSFLRQAMGVQQLPPTQIQKPSRVGQLEVVAHTCNPSTEVEMGLLQVQGHPGL